MVRILVASGLVGALLGATARAADPPLPEALRARWTAAYNSGDVEALGAIYAHDARLQQGYCPAVAGRAAITQFWRDDMAGAMSTTHLTIDDVVGVEDLLYLSGNYAVEIRAESAPTNRLAGTFVQVWRREGPLDWAVVRETWTNLACAEVRIEPDDAERREAATDVAA